MSRANPRGRRSFKDRRKQETRELRKLFIIGVEGETEKAYFDAITVNSRQVKTYVLKGRAPQPGMIADTVQGKLDELIGREELQASDEAWLVFDRDFGANEQNVREAVEWSLGHRNRFIGVSNPNFEFWLLLHFETGTGIGSAKDCLHRLLQSIPNYRKGDAKQLPTLREQLKRAIAHAESRFPNASAKVAKLDELQDELSCQTTVHLLLKQLDYSGVLKK